MVKGPKISVVIPVYNVADYLSRCLESLRRQTLLDIEIVCVNDGSTDNSDEIIREQMKIDSRIQLIDKQNAGVAAARNTGIDAATGDMIVFLDPDDYLTTMRVREFMKRELIIMQTLLYMDRNRFLKYQSRTPGLHGN